MSKLTKARPVVTALVVLVGGALLLLLWADFGGADKPRSAADSVAVPAATKAPSHARVRSRVRATAQAAPQADAPAGTGTSAAEAANEISDHELDQLLIREVPQRIYSASAFCYAEEPGDRESMALSFSIQIADGIGKLENVVIEHSNFAAPALERCVANKLRNLKWKENWAPAGEYAGEMEMTVRGLRQRSRFLAVVPR